MPDVRKLYGTYAALCSLLLGHIRCFMFFFLFKP
jgi:hypothetical protein